jgi:HEAT repeat-containing protein 5
MAESAGNAPPPLPSTLELDFPKLHALPSEQQELFLLTFTADLVQFVESLDGDGASAHQIHVKRTVFQLIGLAHPAPTRVIRTNLGRCLAGIFGKGNRRLLFESINELVAFIGGGKSDRETTVRHAAIYCLGAVYEAAGDSAINLSTLACVTLLKALKTFTGHAGIRASIFQALGRLYNGIGSGAEESTARDVWRQARNAAGGDKSHLVQKSACYCLLKLIERTDIFDNSNDYDKLHVALGKAIESPSVQVRHSAIACWSKTFVKSYSEVPISELTIKPKRPKKATKKAPKPDGDEDEIERPESPAPQKPATALSFSLAAILRQLSSIYCRPATSNRSRASLAICYIMIFRELGEGVVENQYSNIARHLLNDVMSHPAIAGMRYKNLLTRQFVKVVLEEVIGREILGESAQLRAAKSLINDILRDYPQTLKERPEPSKQTLIGALSALSSLILSLGDAFSILAESCRDVLLQTITHPSYTVQVYAAQCLKSFVHACPQHMLPCVTICMNNLTRELGQISSAWQTPRKCVGLANGLAAILSVSTDQPLYGSVEVFSRLLSQATTLLKSSSSSDLRISSTQIQVAWILLGGLMTLGPNFVKIHASQLLLLWKNALPKPVNNENMAQRNILELSFLAHVRECALGCILVFLQHNKRLLTLDVTKRIATMLHNTTSFLASLPPKKTTDDISQRLSPALQLHDFDLMVRRRVLQCYTSLIVDVQQGSHEMLLQSSVLPFTLSCFALPEDYAPSSISAAIASSAGNFDSIWDVDDNYGFGVTTLVRGYDLLPFPGEDEGEDTRHWISEIGGYSDIENCRLSPVGIGREHDSLRLYTGRVKELINISEPPATQVVNASIHLFAVLLPLQPSRVQESVLEQLQSFMVDSSLQRDPARKIAMSVNIATALLGALKVAVRETTLSPGNIRSDAVEVLIKDLLRVSRPHV